MSGQHIAYAMNNKEATEALVYTNSPFELLNPTFFGLECIFFVGIILSIVHAVRYDRGNSTNEAKITLLNCFFYGITIDILSYYTVENFWHGEFSIMFLFNRLPLYIALLYPTFMYHIIMTVKRYDLSPIKGSLVAGFFASTMYLIFDNTGPVLGWWIWDMQDSTTFPYANSVPVTSYHWFFTFAIGLSLVNYWVLKFKDDIAKLVLAMVAQPFLTILAGSLIFVPYNLFGKGMPPYDMLPWDQNLTYATMVHLVFYTFTGWLFYIGWKRPAHSRDTLLLIFPFMYLTGHIYFNVYAFDAMFKANENGLVGELAVGNLVAVILATVTTAALFLVSHPMSRDEK